MTGSSLAPVIIPIVVSISLAAWLIIVYYAASHPEWESARPAPGEMHPAPGEVGPAPRPETAGTPGAPPELATAGSDHPDDQARHRDLVSA
jgi:hypothetical protein